MKKLANFWKSGLLGKFVLIAVPVVIICLACVCLTGSGVAIWRLLPGLASNESTTLAPPTALDSLPTGAGGGVVIDEYGVSLTVTPPTQESVQQASLERANLSQAMQTKIEKAYKVDSLAYSVQLQDGQNGIGSFELALPAPSPDSRLAVLVDGQYLGVLETPAQEGFFRINPGMNLVDSTQTSPGPDVEAQETNYYMVVTPKAGNTQTLPASGKLASPLSLDDAVGKACITEFWTVTNCWRNTEGSIYVFWKNDVPANLADTEMLRINDTINKISTIMSKYQTAGFTAAAISPSNHVYVVIEAGKPNDPAYVGRLGWSNVNLYIPWDIIGNIATDKSRCTFAHELVHWMEKKTYWINVAGATSSPHSWWLDNSAEIGSFLFDEVCIDGNLNEYGKTTKGVGLGFQAAPLQWEKAEESLYIHALQLYLSICDGGTHCIMSEKDWIGAINSGSYPMNSSGLTSYELNAKDLGLFLLGSAPVDSRVNAFIPPSTENGEGYGDYFLLKTAQAGSTQFENGFSEQFSKVSDQQMDVKAVIAKGGVYPLQVSNGGVSPVGKRNTGLPGLLEIKAGPAFWLKQDNAEPIFNPAGTSLKLGPISDQLGIGTARIVAVAPEAEGTFEASLSMADFSGDWGILPGKTVITPIDCANYDPSKAEDYQGLSLVNFFSAYGTYVKDPADPQNANLIWEGTFPEDSLFGSVAAIGSSDVKVSPDELVLHYRIDIPKPTDASLINPWLKPGQIVAKGPTLKRTSLLSGLAFLPMSAGVVWLHSRRRKWARLATVILLVLAAFWLSSCLGSCDFKIWGNMEGTYTFKKAEYVDPLKAAAATEDTGDTGDEGSQGTLFWNLSSGEVVDNWDLTISVKTTDDNGVETEEVSACKMTITDSTATGMIGSSDSVEIPKTGE